MIQLVWLPGIEGISTYINMMHSAVSRVLAVEKYLSFPNRGYFERTQQEVYHVG